MCDDERSAYTVASRFLWNVQSHRTKISLGCRVQRSFCRAKDTDAYNEMV